MRFITPKTIKIITLASTMGNAGLLVLFYLLGELTPIVFLLCGILEFLILLFHFLANTYFIWTNDQLNNIAKLLQSQTGYVNVLTRHDMEILANQKVLMESTKELDMVVHQFFVRFFQLRSKLLQESGDTRKQFEALVSSQKTLIELSKSHLTEINVKISNSSDHLTKEIQSRSKEWTAELANQISNTNKSLKYELSHIYERIDALMAIHQLIKFRRLIPIMNDWAISSDFAHYLLSILFGIPKPNVIDIGSGISTILCGYAVQQQGGGKVISLEHDAYYFEQTKKLIGEHGLDKCVELYHCPLKEYEIGKKKWQWYDISKIKFPQRISVMIVDGPPGNLQPMARYPAVPILSDKLNKNTVILLDDALRGDEKKIAEEWSQDYKMTIENVRSHKGIIKMSLR